jgi:hypothetical protein
VTLKAGEASSDALRKELVAWVRKEIGAIASPDVIQWAPSLPKTRSGKIMRRILRKIAANDFQELGDTSTLADTRPSSTTSSRTARRRERRGVDGHGTTITAIARTPSTVLRGRADESVRTMCRLRSI